MQEYNKAAWEELIYRVDQTGVVTCEPSLLLLPILLFGEHHFSSLTIKKMHFEWLESLVI